MDCSVYTGHEIVIETTYISLCPHDWLYQTKVNIIALIIKKGTILVVIIIVVGELLRVI